MLAATNLCFDFIKHNIYFAENEIDGEAFLLLTDDQIKSIVRPIGAHMKLISKKKALQKVDDCVLVEEEPHHSVCIHLWYHVVERHLQ